MVVLFVLDIFSFLEIKQETLKTFIHFGSLLLTPIIVLFNLLALKSKKWNVWVGLSSLLLIVSFLIVVSQRGFLGYLFSLGGWKTQTVLYEHEQFGFKQIEFQMQDVGALGYNKRNVSVIYLTKWFMITEEIEPSKSFGADWIRVDKNVNELDIVY